MQECGTIVTASLAFNIWTHTLKGASEPILVEGTT